MGNYMNQQTCLLCEAQFTTRDLRTELCGECQKFSPMVKKFRGQRSRLDPVTKAHILSSKFLRKGSGHRYDFYDKGGGKA